MTMQRSTQVLTAMILAVALHGACAADEYTLRPYVIHATASRASSIAIGDVTGDGRADVVMTTLWDNTPDDDYRVFVFAQNDSGRLDAPTKVSYGQTGGGNGNALAIGNFDGQAGIDVAVGGGAAGVSVLHASGSPPWLALAEIRGTRRSYALTTLDLYGRGRADLVSVDRTAGGSKFENQGNGLFIARRWDIGTIDPFSVAKGDVDGDGIDDVAAVSYNSQQNIRLYVNTRDGRLTEAAALVSMCASRPTEHVAIGDVDSDGIADIVATGGGNQPDGCLQVLRGLGQMRYALPLTFASHDSPSGVIVVDIDRDGRNDVVVSHPGHAKVGIYRQNSSGTLAAETLFFAPHRSQHNGQNIAVGDFTGDGCNDIALAGYYGLGTLEGRGPGCDGIFLDSFER